MRLEEHRAARHWPLWCQIAVALGVAVGIVGFISGDLMRRLETSYLMEALRRHSEQTFSLLLAVSVDSVITEDQPLLETIIEQAVSHDPDLYSLKIENEDGTTLAHWRNKQIVGSVSLISFSNDVVVEGETFGRINIEWDVTSIHEGIERHVQGTRLFTTATLILLTIVIIGSLHGLVIRPIGNIHRRLVELAEGGPRRDLSLPDFAARELMRLGASVNSLGEALDERSEREAALAAAYRDLQEGEQRFRTLVSNIPGAVYRSVRDGEWTDEFMSDAIEEITGYPASDFIGNRVRSYMSLVHPGDRAKHDAVADESLVQKKPSALEYRLIHADGRVRWVIDKGQGIFGEDGELLWFDGIIFDITERKQAEEALRAAEETAVRERERLVAAIETIGEGFILCDKDDRVVLVNRRFLEFLPGRADVVKSGVSFETIIRAAAARGLVPRDGDSPERWVERWLAEHRKPSSRAQPVVYDGRHLLITERKTPDGGTVGVYTDITDIKARERELAEKTTLLQTTLDSIAQGLNVFDKDLRLVAWNDRYLEIHGYPPEMGRVGTPFRDFARYSAERGEYGPGEVDKQVRARVQQLKRSPSKVLEHVRWDGRVIEVRRRPLPGGGVVNTVTDVTERKQNEARIQHLAQHDALTDLPNRTLFQDRLGQAMAQATRRRQLLALHFVDLDRFKEINDTLGHPVGDKVLKIVAQRLRGSVRASDTVARFGGDEFAVIQTDLEAAQGAAVLAQNIIDALTRPFRLDGRELYTGATIGVAVFPTDAGKAGQLLQNADVALFAAKGRGGGTFQFFDPEMGAALQARKQLEEELRRALAREEFVVHYQPQVELATGRMVGVEALVRWEHPERGTIAPGAFIPVAESTGLIRSLDAWVLRRACLDARGWREAGLPSFTVAVNLSTVQLRERDLGGEVAEALEAAELPAAALELELTETAMLQPGESDVRTILARLRELGVQLAVDDFGTAYASLSSLHRLPFTKIKIDRSFVNGIGRSADDTEIVRTVIGLGRRLNKGVVAEGVETAAQLEFLRSENCDLAQGYLFSPPVPAAEIPAVARRLGTRRRSKRTSREESGRECALGNVHAG